MKSLTVMNFNKGKIFYELNTVNQLSKDEESFISDEEMQFSDIISRISDDIISKSKKIILLSGPSSSGKTTTSYKLIEDFKTKNVDAVVISLDNFFKNNFDLPVNSEGKKDFESIDALEVDLIIEKINMLINSKKTYFPKFDFNTGRRNDNHKLVELTDNSVAIIEGIHALNNRICDFLPTETTSKIYISAHSGFSLDGKALLERRDVRLIRRIIRDNNYRNCKAERTIQMWIDVCKGEDKNISPFYKTANYNIDTTFPYDPLILKSYVLPLLKEVPSDSNSFGKAQELLKKLIPFDDMSDKYLPANSLLREFIGGSAFKYE